VCEPSIFITDGVLVLFGVTRAAESSVSE